MQKRPVYLQYYLHVRRLAQRFRCPLKSPMCAPKRRMHAQYYPGARCSEQRFRLKGWSWGFRCDSVSEEGLKIRDLGLEMRDTG